MNHMHLINEVGRIAIFERGDHVFVTATPNSTGDEETARRLLHRVADAIRERAAAPVHQRIFVGESFRSFVEGARRDAFLKIGLEDEVKEAPVTFIDGAPPSGAGLSGIVIHAVKRQKGLSAPETVYEGELAVGRRWRSDRADFLVLQDFGADFNPNDGPSAQAERAFERMEQRIRGAGFSFSDVVRTWFYLTDILSWYGDFNKVRSAAYDKVGIMPKPGRDLALPSSTGIGCRSLMGRALFADMLLVRPKDGTRPNRILNPAQKEAFSYGSAFSRAVEIKDDGFSLIEISGTAAIDEQGKSIFWDDAEAQIHCTFDKIEALLSRVGATVRDIASAAVFVKSPHIADIFTAVLKARGLEQFPAIVTWTDVCRDELLFEIDAEAML